MRVNSFRESIVINTNLFYSLQYFRLGADFFLLHKEINIMECLKTQPWNRKHIIMNLKLFLKTRGNFSIVINFSVGNLKKKIFFSVPDYIVSYVFFRGDSIFVTPYLKKKSDWHKMVRDYFCNLFNFLWEIKAEHPYTFNSLFD